MGFGGVIAAITTVAASIVTVVAGVPVVVGLFHTSGPTSSELERTPNLALEFWDGSSNPTLYPMSIHHTKDNDDSWIDVQAKRQPFIMRFPTLDASSDWGGVHICAWNDDSIFNVTPDTSWADGRYESPFVAGKGLADSHAGRASLPLTNEYHSYWVDKRIDHVSDTKDQIYISKLDDTPITQRVGNLYLTVWIDQNQDDEINHGEFEYVVVHFGS